MINEDVNVESQELEDSEEPDDLGDHDVEEEEESQSSDSDSDQEPLRRSERRGIQK